MVNAASGLGVAVFASEASICPAKGIYRNMLQGDRLTRFHLLLGEFGQADWVEVISPLKQADSSFFIGFSGHVKVSSNESSVG